MEGKATRRTKLIILLITAIVVATPALALFRFEWWHDGTESFAGNLSSGMAADETELWFANYESSAPDAQGINVFDVGSDDWVSSLSGGPEGVPISKFRFISIEGSKIVTGGSGGAAIYDRDSKKWTGVGEADGLPSKDVFSGTMREGEYWFGTNEGIGVMEGDGNWRRYTTEDGLADSKVLFLLFDGSILWAGTELGISLFDTDSGEWRNFHEEDGLPGEVARNALIDGENIWFAMKGGVAKMNRDTFEVTSYTPSSHGILSDEVKDVEILGEKIYVATNKGVNYRSRTKESKWKKIVTKSGLPDTYARQGQGSDVTHIEAQGDTLWIALWYEGIVRMTIPTGLAIIPVWVYVVALGGAGIAALLWIRPGAKKGEVSEKEKKVQERRKKVKAQKPAWELCGGVPQRALCNRCKFNSLRSGNLFCAKYKIPIKYSK
jgi:hypothetical protein